MVNLHESFKKYAAESDSVADFLQKHSKPSRHEARGKEYVDARIQSNIEHLNKYGYTFITHHDSKTGEVVSYYGKP